MEELRRLLLERHAGGEVLDRSSRGGAGLVEVRTPLAFRSRNDTPSSLTRRQPAPGAPLLVTRGPVLRQVERGRPARPQGAVVVPIPTAEPVSHESRIGRGTSTTCVAGAAELRWGRPSAIASTCPGGRAPCVRLAARRVGDDLPLPGAGGSASARRRVGVGSASSPSSRARASSGRSAPVTRRSRRACGRAARKARASTRCASASRRRTARRGAAISIVRSRTKVEANPATRRTG